MLQHVMRASVCLFVVTASYGQNRVPVGQGSYASFPPAHEGDGPVEMLTREIYVVDGNNLPIPTNDWWTDLVVSQYAGWMWAYPLAVSADNQGVRVCFPQDFNADGSHMNLGDPLRITGEVSPAAPIGLTVLADFESAAYPPGWVTTGSAFGTGPAAGGIGGQSAVTGYLGERLANSFNGGDGPTGTLTSPEFVITHAYLHFLMAGGNHPDETEVRLTIDGAVVRSATGDDSESLEWQSWDLADVAGATARIEIIDLATGGWGHVCADQFVLSNDATDPGSIFSTRFAPADARAMNWSDWLVRFRSADTFGRQMDVTMGHGLPFVWVECTDIVPRLEAPQPVRYFDENGTVASFPITTDHLGLDFDGRLFGVYLPDGAVLDLEDDALTVAFAGIDQYIAIGALPAESDLAVLQPYAYAIPRETRFDWSFDAAAGTVTTHWAVTAQALKGSGTTVLQGWIPHHYRTTAHDLSFNGLEYTTPRGRLRLASGNTFSIQRPFYGILPNLPAPEEQGDVANDFDAARMDLYLTMYAGVTDYGTDTYWGGKDLVRLARYMAFANELGDTAARDTLRTTLREALADWFIYSPGEEERYFASYPGWGALVGFNESYYSYAFTDHHFHYGYFTMATALLGMYDDTFLSDFGPMVTLVAKQYANWDRDDTRFPYLRTFDPWRGHSYAGGLSSPGGNNQESSSEAIQSWGGLFLLGTMLGDDDMAAAGAMGHAIETEAMLDYWQNQYGAQGGEDVFPPAYEKDIVGILFDDGQAYATYFSGDPAWIYGIQWLPISPALNHLVRDRAFAQAQYDAMMANRDIWMVEQEEGENTFSQMGTSLGNVVLGYLQLFDPDRVADEMDTLWDAEDPIARDNYTGGITYYFTHANRLLGEILWDWRIDIPTSQVYHNAARDAYAYVAYNPNAEHRLATVSSNGVPQGQIHLPPKTLVRATELLIPGAAFELIDHWPADGAVLASPESLTEVVLIFSQRPEAATLNGVTLTGPGVEGFTYDRTVEELIAVFQVQGELEAGASYEVNVPVSVASEGGAALPLARSFTIAIEAEEPPAAALVAHYRLDETAGLVAADASQPALDGTYVGNPPLGEPGARPGSGTSVAFDGATQQVELGEPTELGTLTNDFTISLWVHPTLFGGNRVLFGARWQDYNGWSLRLTGDRVTLERLGPTQVYDSNTSIAAGAWTHVIAVYDAGNDVTFYLDGAAVGTIPGDKPAGVATEPWFIGNNGTGEGVLGRLDDIQLYRRGLSPTEAAFLYNNPGRTIGAMVADLNADGVVNLADYGELAACLTGPAAPVTAGCGIADMDENGVVDLADFQWMQRTFR